MFCPQFALHFAELSMISCFEPSAREDRRPCVWKQVDKEIPFRILLVSFIYIFVLVPRCSLRWASGTPLAFPQTVTWPSSSADARLS